MHLPFIAKLYPQPHSSSSLLRSASIASSSRGVPAKSRLGFPLVDPSFLGFPCFLLRFLCILLWFPYICFGVLLYCFFVCFCVFWVFCSFCRSSPYWFRCPPSTIGLFSRPHHDELPPCSSLYWVSVYTIGFFPYIFFLLVFSFAAFLFLVFCLLFACNNALTLMVRLDPL